MKHTIENDLLEVNINEKGAELDSIRHKKFQLEYMWDGDPAFWAKKSPVLFPIVGALKHNEYFFNNQSYTLGRHGFAREKQFSLTGRSEHELTFSLTDDAETMDHYPFHFRCQIVYSLREDTLQVGYVISNTGDNFMYFSIGGHPAFKLPLVSNTGYADYYLEFEHPEEAVRWPVSVDGLIEAAAVPLMKNTRRLPINKELFYQDAIVFKQLRSGKVSIMSDKTIHGLELVFAGFPYLGIWAAKNADFICIEPWCGIADNIHSDQDLGHKEGINMLQAGGIFKRSWKLRLF